MCPLKESVVVTPKAIPMGLEHCSLVSGKHNFKSSLSHKIISPGEGLQCMKQGCFDANEITNGKANPIMHFCLGILHSFIFSGKKKTPAVQYGKCINHVTTLAGIIY